MKKLKIHHPTKILQGKIFLPGSKSISNRLLIIRELLGRSFEIENLSSAKDTTTLERLLREKPQVWDAGHAGTTFRFLTAYLAFQEGSQTLTGSARMLERPIGPLVEGLRQLGARIEYMGEEGYPPLRIHTPNRDAQNNHAIMNAGISSQFLSALLLVAPTLPNGLRLELQGDLVSPTYLDMTIRLMAKFGVPIVRNGQLLEVPSQPYQFSGTSARVEADWSSAGYYYVMATLAEKADIQLLGLAWPSVQGDAVVSPIMESFGIKSTLNEEGIRIQKMENPSEIVQWEYDFLSCPDLVQTVAVLCAALGVKGHFSGLRTLKIKETDRVEALREELAKVGVNFQSGIPGPNKELDGIVQGKASVNSPTFRTYKDHRMAMAFSPLAMLGDIKIEDPGVVEKSYPDFWEDLKKLGFIVVGK